MDIDSIMEIWLESNIQAHDFIDKSYWKANYNLVKKLISQAELYRVFDGEELLGFAGVEDGYLAGIFVKDSFRGQGLGKKLLDQIKLNYDSLSLKVYEKNIGAYKFYLKNGFFVHEKIFDESNKELEYLMLWNKEV